MSASALRWIVAILRDLDIPFLVVGGLAARAYGASRPLVDIDLYIPGSRFDDLVPRVRHRITFGPERQESEHWDLTYMALECKGCRIELGDGSLTRYKDGTTGQWVEESIDFDDCELLQIHGLEVPVMKREHLVAYKTSLGREVDLIDIEQMRSAGPDS